MKIISKFLSDNWYLVLYLRTEPLEKSAVHWTPISVSPSLNRPTCSVGIFKPPSKQ